MGCKIVFDRNKCIGAFSCVQEDPESWKQAEDGKVDLNNSKETGKGIFELKISDDKIEKSKTAASVCPVAAIQIVEED